MSSKVPSPPSGKASAGEAEKPSGSPERASAALDWKDLPVVVTETCYGRVAGIREADGLILFQGMPYALAPKGTLRFRPPQELMPWEGILPAFRFGPVCPQIPAAFAPSSFYPQDEDCLSLNVWTPGIDDKRRPVLVFIHGGAFINGSSAESAYDGSTLSRRGDMVVVTANYRLGALGFLYLEDMDSEFAESGNLGLLDQIAALKWVQKSIDRFGGDSGNVTIMGQSAGSISVTTLMAAPEAGGLFKRSIAESGAPNLCHSKESAALVASKFLKLAQVKDVEGLRSLTPFQLMDVQEKLLKQSGLSASNLFAPVIDGRLLPQDPFKALENGAAKEIPLLLGTNKDEVRLWLIYQGLLAHAPPLALLAIFPNSREVFGSRMVEVLARYRLSRLLARPGDVTLEVATDAEFWIPQVRLAEIQSRYAPTWMYRFDWPSPAKNGELGACHALELPFVFHNFHTPQAAHMVGQSPPSSLAERIQGAWIAFVRTGEPKHWGSASLASL
ncbi:MAG TPA: carboxylesterase/lipase family protein [Methanotrichaceae archaeon]|nr:carboxylesterase/lipase family protein [Methanotrichaceae archaeon]